jgi:hypothetical protein
MVHTAGLAWKSAASLTTGGNPGNIISLMAELTGTKTSIDKDKLTSIVKGLKLTKYQLE